MGEKIKSFFELSNNKTFEKTFVLFISDKSLLTYCKETYSKKTDTSFVLSVKKLTANIILLSLIPSNYFKYLKNSSINSA